MALVPPINISVYDPMPQPKATVSLKANGEVIGWVSGIDVQETRRTTPFSFTYDDSRNTNLTPGSIEIQCHCDHITFNENAASLFDGDLSRTNQVIPFDIEIDDGGIHTTVIKNAWIDYYTGPGDWGDVAQMRNVNISADSSYTIVNTSNIENRFKNTLTGFLGQPVSKSMQSQIMNALTHQARDMGCEVKELRCQEDPRNPGSLNLSMKMTVPYSTDWIGWDASVGSSCFTEWKQQELPGIMQPQPMSLDLIGEVVGADRWEQKQRAEIMAMAAEDQKVFEALDNEAERGFTPPSKAAEPTPFSNEVLEGITEEQAIETGLAPVLLGFAALAGAIIDKLATTATSPKALAAARVKAPVETVDDHSIAIEAMEQESNS